MIAIVWQFNVKNGREAEFEQLYGADGEWTTMNRLTRSYLGSSLPSRSESGITVSRHRVLERNARGRKHHKSYRPGALAEFEARRTDLVESTEPLGVFTALDVPDRFGPTVVAANVGLISFSNQGPRGVVGADPRAAQGRHMGRPLQ